MKQQNRRMVETACTIAKKDPCEGGFTPLEIMLRCSAEGLHFRTIPAGFNAPLEFLTGFTHRRYD